MCKVYYAPINILANSGPIFLLEPLRLQTRALMERFKDLRISVTESKHTNYRL